MKNLIVILFLFLAFTGKAQKPSLPSIYVTTFNIDSVWIGIGPADMPMTQFPSNKRITHYPIEGVIVVFTMESVDHRDFLIIKEPILKIYDTLVFKMVGYYMYDSLSVLRIAANKKSGKDFSSPEYMLTYITRPKSTRLTIVQGAFPTKRMMYFLTRKNVKKL